jgi:hypothetical protein
VACLERFLQEALKARPVQVPCDCLKLGHQCVQLRDSGMVVPLAIFTTDQPLPIKLRGPKCVEKLVPSPRRPSCSCQQGVQAHECITFADLLLRELSNAGAECGRTLTFGCVQRLSNGYAVMVFTVILRT